MRILAVNAGSSSLKLRVIGPDDAVVATADLARRTHQPVGAALSRFLEEAGSFDAVGHRFVHGGDEFRAPVLLDERPDDALERLTDLAPLHNPPAIEAVRMMRRTDLEIAGMDARLATAGRQPVAEVHLALATTDAGLPSDEAARDWLHRSARRW